jgi:hypothetical protein
MNQWLFLCFVGLLAALAAAAFFLFRLKFMTKAKTPPESCMGAIRVTRQGRDMLIIQKEDGSFEMHEEQEIRKP